jgi:serine/threonine protein kinase
MIGTRVGHYEIIEKLGQGGMGVVYKALDTKLDRPVALKFLPEHLAATEADCMRFLQEAKSAAALNHPNVCSIIDVQETDGRPFIVMEYVDGVTLRMKSPLPNLDIAIEYAGRIGEALQAAHARGIVHRDIKSENVMVTAEGRIKVMDFGLARLKDSAHVTRTGSTLGTLAYMAPEQMQGTEVDPRADIFSFGVVVFEMLTGKLPFKGEHEAAIMYSILNEEPESVQRFRPDAPADLDRILRRALEKDPADRYQHVDDMVSELRKVKKQTERISRSIRTAFIASSRSRWNEENSICASGWGRRACPRRGDLSVHREVDPPDHGGRRASVRQHCTRFIHGVPQRWIHRGADQQSLQAPRNQNDVPELGVQV